MVQDIAGWFMESVEKALSALEAGGTPILCLILLISGFTYLLGKSHGSNKDLQNKFAGTIVKLDGLFGKLQRIENNLNSLSSSSTKNFEVLKEHVFKSYERIKKIYKNTKPEGIREDQEEKEENRVTVEQLFKDEDSAANFHQEQSHQETDRSGDEVTLNNEKKRYQETIWQRLANFGIFNILTKDRHNLNLEELRERLILADVGTGLTDFILNELNGTHANDHTLKSVISSLLAEKPLNLDRSKIPQVLVFVGVNGAGKTSSLAKLAFRLKNSGFKVLTVAADTFRAGAEEQLVEWSKKVGVECYFEKSASKPQTVIFDALKKATEDGFDAVLIDTAGRLHNKSHLMQELQGIKSVIRKVTGSDPSETFLVLDATAGQTAFNQAKEFSEIVNVTSVILTKLDSSAKGGMILRISKELNLPISFVSVGEDLDSLIEFKKEEFVERIVA
ncbi:MAG: signal recognition particle-docking protein FtsY [Deltaproteobacteria bacterium]|nr:signal recognition particle-docking protein FtsY [Deltaproteobacteria bacterium]